MKNGPRKTFFEHLEDMRALLIYCCIVVLIGSVISFLFSKQLLKIIILPAHDLLPADISTADMGISLFQSLHPSEVFLASIKISVVAGLGISLPILLFIIWKYIEPALENISVRQMRVIVLSSLPLFIAGIIFAYYVVIPLVLRFLFAFSIDYGIRPAWALSNYLGFVVNMLLVFGIAFELPLVTVVSSRTGLIDIGRISGYRKYMVVMILVLSAILTPPDIFSQLALSIPLIALFEMSLLISRFLMRKEINKN